MSDLVLAHTNKFTLKKEKKQPNFGSFVDFPYICILNCK